jgi:hypothetical protein
MGARNFGFSILDFGLKKRISHRVHRERREQLDLNFDLLSVTSVASVANSSSSFFLLAPQSF